MPRVAVHLGVDERRDRDARARSPRARPPRSAPSEIATSPVTSGAADERGRDAEPAGAGPGAGRAGGEPSSSSAGRSRPVVALEQRGAAAAGSVSPTSIAAALFARQSHCSSASRARSGLTPAISATMRVARSRSFCVRRAQVDHQPAVGLAELDHRGRRDDVEDDLLGRARVEPRRARDDLGPDERPRSGASASAASGVPSLQRPRPSARPRRAPPRSRRARTACVRSRRSRRRRRSGPTLELARSRPRRRRGRPRRSRPGRRRRHGRRRARRRPGPAARRRSAPPPRRRAGRCGPAVPAPT